MQSCMDVVLPYVGERQQFGKRIGEFQVGTWICIQCIACHTQATKQLWMARLAISCL